MCGHTDKTNKISTNDTPFEGTTQRLSLERRRNGFRAFPWWTLWLIWPLMAFLKGIGATIAHGWFALGEWSIPVNVFFAVILIIAGAGLLLWQRARKLQ